MRLHRAEARCSDGRRGCCSGTTWSRARARVRWRGSLGVSRDTVHRWIRDGDLDRDLDATPVRYGPRPPVPTKLDAYKAIIETRLAAYPELSAVRLLDGDPRRRLRRRLHAAESVRAAGAADAAAGAGDPVRDAGGSPGAGRLRAISRFPGACGTRCSSCSATRGCSGAGSIRARTCATLIDGLEDAFRLFRRRPAGAALRSDEGGDHARPAAARAARWSAISSFSASRTTGASRRAPVGPIARRPRAKSSVPSATCATISSTVGPSCNDADLDQQRQPVARRASRMCECTARRASGHATASIATSVCLLQPLAPRRYTSLRARRDRGRTARSAAPRPVVAVEKRSLAVYAQPRGRCSHEERRPVPSRPPAPDPRRPAHAGCARSPRCDPPGRRWRHAHGPRGHRAAARRADSAAQQPTAAGRDALQPAARRQTARATSTSPSSRRSVASRSRVCTSSASSSAARM